jgi:hypothetical protein
MLATPSFFKSNWGSAQAVRFRDVFQPLGIVAIALLVSAGCRPVPTSIETRQVHIQQGWELQPGKSIAGHRVVAGLGDVSIRLRGTTLHAPFDGKVEPADMEDCVIFSSPKVPAYLLRLCGLSRPRLGAVLQGDRIGTGNILHFATLRKQPDGTWAIVEPSLNLIETALTPP